MTVTIADDTLVISGEDKEVIFSYNKVTKGVAVRIEDEGFVAETDMDILIQALTAVKNTKDNELRRQK